MMSGQLGQYRRGSTHLLADHDLDAGIQRQVQIDPRTKTNEAITLATAQWRSRLDVAKDARRDEAGNLNTGDIPAISRLQPQGIALVFCRGLGKVGIDELARVLPALSNLAVDRAAV